MYDTNTTWNLHHDLSSSRRSFQNRILPNKIQLIVGLDFPPCVRMSSILPSLIQTSHPGQIFCALSHGSLGNQTDRQTDRRVHIINRWITTKFCAVKGRHTIRVAVIPRLVLYINSNRIIESERKYG